MNKEENKIIEDCQQCHRRKNEVQKSQVAKGFGVSEEE